MRPCRLTVAAFVLTVTALACSEPQPTPPEVLAEFEALGETLDEQRPGWSVARLTDFKTWNREFDIVPEVEHEIDRFLVLSEGLYHEARELAREGDFDGAEAILLDLATHLPETSDGESAAEHLEFDFYYGQAQWLMARQEWIEGGEVARLLMERDLTRAQEDQLEAILDAVGNVGAAYSEAQRAQARAACRHLMIYLEMTMADEGEYPSRLTLPDVEAWDPIGSRSILRHLSSIEDYRRTEIGFSFTAVSAAGGHRIRVVDGVIEE